jgi:hypothetical protein
MARNKKEALNKISHSQTLHFNNVATAKVNTLHEDNCDVHYDQQSNKSKFQFSTLSVSIKTDEDDEMRIEYPINNNLTYFSGRKFESVSNCLRQFKNFIRLYKGFNNKNLHLFASSYLTKEAANFYDNLENEP